jgi:hypothetical protein
MKHNKLLFITLIIGIVNLMINYIFNWSLKIGNKTIFLLNIQKSLFFYIIVISGLVTAIIIIFLLKEIRLRKNYYIIATSLAINTIYAVIFFGYAKDIIYISLNG